jgi:protein-tyrosine phosphatase
LSHRNRTRVLFVCLANICRSPTAEAVFRQHVKQAGLADRILVDSAGTAAYHTSEPPDSRARRVALQRGYDLTGLRARQVDRTDFAEFDYIVVMDLENLRALAPLCPPEHGHKVKLFADYCSTGACTISDPYIGGPDDFAHMLDRIEDGADGLLRHIIREMET